MPKMQFQERGKVSGGFVKLRRDVRDHLKSGRMSADEWSAFSLILTLVDFRSAIWIGSGVAISDYLKWCQRKSQMVLSSLSSKGYIELRNVHGRKGNYPIYVRKFHGSAHGDAVIKNISASRCGDRGLSAHGDATLKEVVLKNKRKEEVAVQQKVSPYPVLRCPE